LLDRFGQNLQNLNVNEDNQNLVNQSQRRQKEKEDNVDTAIEDPDTQC
jgi:hypothetical protein